MVVAAQPPSHYRAVKCPVRFLACRPSSVRSSPAGVAFLLTLSVVYERGSPSRRQPVPYPRPTDLQTITAESATAGSRPCPGHEANLCKSASVPVNVKELYSRFKDYVMARPDGRGTLPLPEP